MGETLRYRPRGPGANWGIPCFVCGKRPDSLHGDMAAFVESRDAGERCVALFDGLARLDYREYEPHRVQVKVGVCADHTRSLECLYDLTKWTETISKDVIAKARRADDAPDGR